MSITLRMADGDLFIHPATGQGETIDGPTKVDQEMFSCYATTYDPARLWGSNFDLSLFPINSPAEFRAILSGRLAEANSVIRAKQRRDTTLDKEREEIQKFTRSEVLVDTTTGTGVFVVVAKVGIDGTEVGKALPFNYQPTSLKHATPPAFPAVKRF